MSYNVSLYAFEGPLDLLCHLVKKKEINIYDIPISEITDEYLEYVNQWKEMDIEIASEFLVMAANLMEIKSKMLLPSSVIDVDDNEEDDESDPRETLIRRLIEYKFFKNIAANLAVKEAEQSKLYRRMKNMKDDYLEEKENTNFKTCFDNLNIINLIEAFNKVVERTAKENNAKNELENIKNSKITVTVKEKKNLLLYNLEKSGKSEMIFQDLMSQNSSSSQELVVSFLALLELIKEGLVDVFQEGAFAPIWIKLNILTVKTLKNGGEGYNESLQP